MITASRCKWIGEFAAKCLIWKCWEARTPVWTGQPCYVILFCTVLALFTIRLQLGIHLQCTAAYHLHRKTGILGEKFKWYVPFHWKIFESFGKPRTYSSFSISTEMSENFCTHLRLSSHLRIHRTSFFARLATSRKQNGGHYSIWKLIFTNYSAFFGHHCTGKFKRHNSF